MDIRTGFFFSHLSLEGRSGIARRLGAVGDPGEGGATHAPLPLTPSRKGRGDRRRLVAVLIASCLGPVALNGCTAIKAATTRATTDLSALAQKTPAGTYKSDPEHTTLIFKVRHFNFSTFVGRFDDIDGTLQWDPANPQGSKLEVIVDTASIDTRLPALNGQLQDASFFDSKNQPQARFVSTMITETSKNTGEIRGDLTIKNQTHPLTLEVTFNGGDVNGLTGKPTLGFSATAEIQRSAWGLGEWFPVVGNDVKLEIEAEFVKAN